MHVVSLASAMGSIKPAHVAIMITLNSNPSDHPVVKSWLKLADAALSLVWVQLAEEGNGGKIAAIWR